MKVGPARTTRAGPRTDSAFRTAALIATFRCDAPAGGGASPMSGASSRRRRLRPGDANTVPKVIGHRRACASLVASFTAGVREPAIERISALHTDVLIATFRCAAPARAARAPVRGASWLHTLGGTIPLDEIRARGEVASARAHRQEYLYSALHPGRKAPARCSTAAQSGRSAAHSGPLALLFANRGEFRDGDLNEIMRVWLLWNDGYGDRV